MTGPHTDCATCAYWERRISEERQRALQGLEGAFTEEKRVCCELAAHLDRTENMPATQPTAEEQ